MSSRSFNPLNNTHHNNHRSKHFPGPFPEDPGIRIEPEHLVQIIQEAIGSVDPGHDGHLYTAQYEGAVGGAVVVEDLEDVDAAIGDHGETHQEHEAADAERHPLPVVPPEVGELVQQDGDDGLRGGELRPEAEEEKHQEEETTPERRERHLQYSLWVGDKSQAGT